MPEKRVLRTISLRLTRAELAAIDDARGEAARNAWVRGAIRTRLGNHAPVADAVALQQPTISGTQPVPGQAQRELAVVPGVRRGVAA
jgi:hypothetical protein